MSGSKIKSLDELIEIREKLREEKKTVVTTNGSFDILHAGHVRSLRESKSQGDVLIVGINSDKSVKVYKSPDRPIVPEEQRAEMVAALQCVDYVFMFNELNPIAFIEKIRPDVHANGADYGENCVEKEAVLKNGGRLHLLKKYDEISTSGIIKKILTTYKQ